MPDQRPEPPAADPGLPAGWPYHRVLVIGTGAISVALLPVLVSTLVWHYRAEVTVALTAAATRLVSAEALSAFSRRPVEGPGWPADASAGPAHVELAEWADLVLVWPATLDFCVRHAYGLTSDLPSAALAATGAPVVLAPSLTQRVADGVAYRRARQLLLAAGVTIVGPTVGRGVGGDHASMGACVSVAALLQAAANLPHPDNTMESP